MSRRSNNSLANGDQNDYASHQASAQVIKLVYSSQREFFEPNSCNINELTSETCGFICFELSRISYSSNADTFDFSKCGTCLSFLNMTYD